MSAKNHMAKELSKFIEAVWVELPLAAAERFAGRSGEENLNQAGWKAYDAFISLTNEATNLLYASPLTGLIAGRAMESSLRWQQSGNALASAFFGNLWPAIGLPTADQVANLRAEVGALRRDFNEAAEVAETEADHREFHPAEGLSLVRSAKVKSIKSEDNKDAAA